MTRAILFGLCVARTNLIIDSTAQTLLRHPTYVFSETAFPSYPGVLAVTFVFNGLRNILALAFAAFLVQPVGAQALLEGTWTAHFLTPGGEIASATYQVSQIGNHLAAEMEFGGRKLPLTEYRVDGGSLTFAMDTGFRMECRFERQAERQFKGSCLDPKGNVGPAVIGPPGVAAEPEDFDFDEAFEVWDLSREEYEQERTLPWAEPKESFVPEPEQLPTRMVDVGGYSLNVVELGDGEVTVVLESGIGDDHKVWYDVQKALGERTRVISYDRAGLGMSDASSAPRSSEGIARELRELLAAQGIKPPYVLVGHQAGGLYVREFQTLYPNAVAGLVLVDPSEAGEDELWRSLDADSYAEYLAQKRSFFSTISDVAAREFDAYTDQLQSDHPSSIEPLADVPVVVLSGLRPFESPRWVGETQEGLKAKEELHRSLADALGGDFIASAKGSTYIHLEDPQLVVDAVNRILDAIVEE